VIGLTTAIRLLQRGFAVRVVARSLSPHTTSDVAAAIWYPYLVEPRERVLRWSRATREEMLARIHGRKRVVLKTPAAVVIREERDSA
jgi:D-amino-acid oxidase